MPPLPLRIPGRRLLHSPGPTPLPDAVLHAMSAQPMDLADPRVDANIAACESGPEAQLLHTETPTSSCSPPTATARGKR